MLHFFWQWGKKNPLSIMHAYFPTAEVTELAETEKEKKILPPES